MQFLYDKQVVVKRYSSTLGEYNRPNKTLVELVLMSAIPQRVVLPQHSSSHKKRIPQILHSTQIQRLLSKGEIFYISMSWMSTISLL